MILVMFFMYTLYLISRNNCMLYLMKKNQLIKFRLRIKPGKR